MRTRPATRPAKRPNRASALPPASPEFAYFLDFDGTLLEIAARPDRVCADVSLRRLLSDLRRACDGAVALISGRRIVDIDALLDAPGLPVAGMHGLERRDARGRWHCPPAGTIPEALRNRLAALEACYPGLLVEDKGATIAVHYRQRPALASWLHRLLARYLQPLPQLTVLRGKCVLEIRPRGGDKGTAVAAFLDEAPFAGRRPVFIGDDVTDEDGFTQVNRRGGLSIKVGRGRTGAALRLADVAEVRQWLADCRPTAAAPGVPT